MKTGVLAAVMALAVCLIPATSSLAQDMRGMYVAPKLIYSHQKVKSSAGLAEINYKVNPGDQTKGKLGGGIAVGYDFAAQGAPVRLELEYAQRAKWDFVDEKYSIAGLATATEKARVGVSSVFANVFYDFHNYSKFTPYIGGGLGLAQLDASYNGKISGTLDDGTVVEGRLDMNDDSWNFAWNLGAGVSYQINDFAAVDLNYRYADFGDVSEKVKGRLLANGLTVYEDRGGYAKADVTAHEVILGLRFFSN